MQLIFPHFPHLLISIPPFLHCIKSFSNNKNSSTHREEEMHPSLLLPLLFLLLATSTRQCSSSSEAGDLSMEHLDPTLPPALPDKTPDCSVHVLHHEFAGETGSSPASTTITQPDGCPAPWTRVVLDLTVSASDVQKNRVAAVWLAGAEVLRTTTQLTMNPAVFWRVQKDITRYTAILRHSVVISMMLDNNSNSPDAVLAGSYIANISLHFYRGWVAEESATNPTRVSFTAHPVVKGLYRRPANLIIPISNNSSGFWFQINNRSHLATTSIAIPRNSYRAVLEIFASYHAADEFWYANPLRNSFDDDDLLDASKANGGYRQLYATIDGKFVGGHIPFPVIYPGSINPYLWSPVAAIGAFDLPSYDLDVTPFLALLLDGEAHEIGLGVRESQPYWLLTGNLHIWVDKWSNTLQAGLIEYLNPSPVMTRHAEWGSGDGSSEVDASGLVRFKGWVSSSQGNLTTEVRQKVTFKSQVAVQNLGAVRKVEMVNKERTSVGVHRGSEVVGRVRLFVEMPLQIETSSERAAGGAEYERSRLSHQLLETVIVNDGKVVSTIELTDRQEAEGSAMVRDGVAIWGSGATRSNYKYVDESTCYLRSVDTDGGVVKVDATSPSCSSVADG